MFSDAMKVVEEAREKALQPLEERWVKFSKFPQRLTSYTSWWSEEFRRSGASSDMLFVRRAKAMDKEQHLIQELQGEIDKLKKAISKLDTNFQVSPLDWVTYYSCQITDFLRP